MSSSTQYLPPSSFSLTRFLQHPTWASRYIYLLATFLQNNYHTLISKCASYHNRHVVTLPEASAIASSPIWTPTTTSSTTTSSLDLNICQPTVLLRLEPPGSSKSIIVRALLDTGTTQSTLFPKLATHLLKVDGIEVVYHVPLPISTFSGSPNTLNYYSLGPLTIRSVEDPSRTIPNLLLPVSCRMPYSFDYTPYGNLGIQIKNSKLGPTLNRHLFETDQEKKWGSFTGNLPELHPAAIWMKASRRSCERNCSRVDMIIGQDLLARAFLLSGPEFPVERPLSIVETSSTEPLSCEDFYPTSRYSFLPTAFGLTMIGHLDCRFQIVPIPKDWLAKPENQTQLKTAIGQFQSDDTAEDHQKAPIWCDAQLRPLLEQTTTTTTLGATFSSLIITFHSILLACLTLLLAYPIRLLFAPPPGSLFFFSIFSSAQVHLFGAILSTLTRLQATLIRLSKSESQLIYSFQPYMQLIIHNPNDGTQQGVMAEVDTGSPQSFISRRLVSSLGLVVTPPVTDPMKARNADGSTNDLPSVGVNLQATSTAHSPLDDVTLYLLPNQTQSTNTTNPQQEGCSQTTPFYLTGTRQPPSLCAAIQAATNGRISLQPHTLDSPVDLILGGDIIGRLRVYRHLHLATNLMLHETCLGSFLCGAQMSRLNYRNLIT